MKIVNFPIRKYAQHLAQQFGACEAQRLHDAIDCMMRDKKIDRAIAHLDDVAAIRRRLKAGQ